MEDAFLVALEQVRRRLQIRIYGYVIMPEHVHMLVSEPDCASLAEFMQLLKTKVSVQARKAQKRAAGDEPFWQTRYFDHNVRNHAGFVTQLRYIHRNPVKRGLCNAPEDWQWSSFRA
jgi:putative transposase